MNPCSQCHGVYSKRAVLSKLYLYFILKRLNLCIVLLNFMLLLLYFLFLLNV